MARFRPAIVDGAPAMEQRIIAGDPRRYCGHRSGVVYEGAKILQHGVDYWFAMAIKLDGGWSYTGDGGNGDRASFFDTHQDIGTANPFGLQWIGTGPSRGLHWIVASYASGGGSPVRIYTLDP